MGHLDLFAKRTFAEETARVTDGAVIWQDPPEVQLEKVQSDGWILIRRPDLLASLSSPWPAARPFDEVVVELKLAGDHVDRKEVETALLRLRDPGALARPGRHRDKRRRGAAVDSSIRSDAPERLMAISRSEREDLLWRFGKSDDPVIEARRQRILEVLLDTSPHMQQKLIEQGRLAEARAALQRVLALRELVLAAKDDARIKTRSEKSIGLLALGGKSTWSHTAPRTMKCWRSSASLTSTRVAWSWRTCVEVDMRPDTSCSPRKPAHSRFQQACDRDVRTRAHDGRAQRQACTGRWQYFF